jgi:group I intron endonuclease
MAYIVYQITNTVNGKRYIGHTRTTLKVRWDRHRESASRVRRGKQKPYRFANAINKHGHDAFVREVLFEEETLAGAKESEILLILDREPGYNMTLGGDGLSGKALEELSARSKGNAYAKDRIVSEEERAAISKRMKKFHQETPLIFDDEYRQKLSKAQTGRKHPQKVKDQIGASNKGRVCSQKCRDAVAAANRRRQGEKRGPRSEATKEKIRLKLLGREPPNKGKKMTLTEKMIEGQKKSAETRRGKKRGPYKVKVERSPAQLAADARRRGVTRGPYKKRIPSEKE